MVTTFRFGFFTVLAALAALALDVDLSTAQYRRGVSIQSGGSNSSSSSSSSNSNQGQNQNNNNNNNNNNDDNNNRRSGRSGNSGGSGNSSSSTSQNIQQGLQILQGGGVSQGSNQGNNQGNMRSMRGTRSGSSQQGTIGIGQGGTIQLGNSSQQNQNFQPWQMWQGQNNRGNNNNNNFRGRSGNSNNSNWIVQVGGGPSPFSVGWYEKHPHAWHNHSHNNDVWKVATAASVVGWLGWGTPHTHYVEYRPSNTYIFDPNASGPWMLLGVYTLLTGPSDMGTRTLQLSINQQGYLRGTYYDMISNEVYNVRGRVDQSSQYAQWSLDTNRDLIFYAPLYQLTQSQGVVNANLPGGTQQWQLARMEYAQ